MGLTMQEHKTVTKALSKQYRRATKGEKDSILDQFVESTGYDRHYAAWLLRHGQAGRSSKRRPETAQKS